MLNNKVIKISGLSLVFILAICTILYYHNIVNINSDKADAIRMEYTIPYMSDIDLAASSSLIIQGYVKSVSPAKWNTSTGAEPDKILQNDIIYKDTLVTISEILKGEVNENEVIVRTYGGDYPQGKNIKKIDTGDAYGSFSKGENVILFLTVDDSNYNKEKSNKYYILKGMNQGKYIISNNTVSNVHGSQNIDDFYINVKNHINDVIKPNVKGDF